jgi:hypothetical protein
VRNLLGCGGFHLTVSMSVNYQLLGVDSYK